MLKGRARSVTRAAPFASRWTISRRVGSESAEKARSRTGVVIYSTYGLTIPPVSSDRKVDLRQCSGGDRQHQRPPTAGTPLVAPVPVTWTTTRVRVRAGPTRHGR